MINLSILSRRSDNAKIEFPRLEKRWYAFVNN